MTLTSDLGQIDAVPSALGDRFALGSRLGKGSMGEVFLARDTFLRRDLAVKVLGPVGHASAIARFLREAQVTAQLTHPNVVPIYSLERTEAGGPALAMKLIQGVTFGEYLNQCSAAMETPEPDLARYGVLARIEHFLKACDAIDYSHDRGVVHRDIKLENLMLGAFGEVYVVDWGIARVLDESPENDLPSEPLPQSLSPAEGSDDDTLRLGPAGGPNDGTDDGTLTRFGDVVGTLRYMAPEQAWGNRDDLAPAADQYALGMVLFELVTGFVARPSGAPGEQVLSVARRGGREPFAEVPMEVPRSLQAIIDRATQVGIADRYPSVRTFADDLRRYLHGEEVMAWPDSPPRKVWRRLQRYPMTVMSVVLASVMLAAVVAVGSLWTVLESERTQADQQETLSSLVATVSRHVQEFDRKLSHIEILLEGLAVATRGLLAHPDAPTAGPMMIVDLREGRGPSDTAHLTRYDQEVTFERPAHLVPSIVDPAEVLPMQQRLFGLEKVFREIALRSFDEYSVALPIEAAIEKLRAGVPMQWAYLGFTNGLLINYPGNHRYPADYDPRLRPWFMDTQELRGPNYGTLYADASGSGYLLPCNRSIHDDDDNLIGVAGIDVSMDHVIEDMDVPGIDGVRETWLLGAEGQVLVRSSERGTRTDIEMKGRKATTSIGIADLEQHARNGTASGFVRQGNALYVFARLETVPWLLVAEIDPRAQDL